MDTFYAVFDIDFEIISHSSQQSFAIWIIRDQDQN